jgi:glucan phosphoethanolaminetransferase (alkaline phosphatase superfamily)
MAAHDEFIYIIAFYGFLMLATLVVCIVRYRIAPRACSLIISGIAIAAIAAAVQASHVHLFTHFNHNDLYHVIQMVSLYVIYRGAREIP